jgi:rubrerythrin
MNIEEAIKTAIEYETRVRDLYVQAMGRAVDPAGKKVFKTLAKDEQEHLNYLNDRLDHWNETGKLDEPHLETVIPPKKKIEEGIQKLGEGIISEGRETEVELLKKAMEAEMETSNFYKKMVSELPAEGQKMFSRFVEIEEGHLAIVQAELNLLSGTGYWYDFPEINLEAG